MSILKPLFVIGILLTASGFAADILGEYVGPIEYKGYLVFDYPEGENPITNIVFNLDPSLSDSLIIVSVPSPWSHSYGGGTLTLSGGSLSPGGTVRVTVSLNKYHEEGEYPVSSVGTTSTGEVSQASGPLLVGNLILLNLLGMVSAFRLPLAGVTVGLGFLEWYVFRRKRVGPEDLQMTRTTVDTVDDVVAGATDISTKPRSCQELVDECTKARASAKAAEAEAKSAKQKSDSANLDNEKAKKGVQEAQRKLDNALKKPSDKSEAWVEMDGRRITSLDLRLRKEASRAVWDQYRRGDIDAKSLEDAWEELGEHGALEELRKKSWEARKEAAEKALERAKDQAKGAEDRTKEANAEATRTRNKAAEAKSYADKVCKEADDCVKAQPKTPKKPTGEEPPTDGGVIAPGGASVADDTTKTSERICVEGKREKRPAGRPESLTAIVDFSLYIENKETTRDEEAARILSYKLGSLAQDIGLAGSLLGGAGSGKSIIGGFGGMRQGSYVTGAGGLISGTATAVMTGAGAGVGSGQMKISIPTSPPEAIAELLKGVSNLGSIVSKKAAKWIKMNNTYGARVRFFEQILTATPIEIWECKGNKWICVEKVYEITISQLKLGTETGQRAEFKLESDSARAKFNQHINTLEKIVKNELRKSVEARRKFEQEHQRGPCGS